MGNRPLNADGEEYRIRAEGCSCGWAVCRCPVDFIVYFAGLANGGEWIVERVSDKQEMARGGLADMMALVEGETLKFPNGRRAHSSEDMLRLKPSIFFCDYKNGSNE